MGHVRLENTVKYSNLGADQFEGGADSISGRLKPRCSSALRAFDAAFPDTRASFSR
jgi:hypothetical protein